MIVLSRQQKKRSIYWTVDDYELQISCNTFCDKCEWVTKKLASSDICLGLSYAPTHTSI